MSTRYACFADKWAGQMSHQQLTFTALQGPVQQGQMQSQQQHNVRVTPSLPMQNSRSALHVFPDVRSNATHIFA